MPQSISSWLWKPMAVILVFIVASGLTRVIMGSDEPQLSSRQQALLDGLRERTGELVVQHADIKSLPGDWYKCSPPPRDDYDGVTYRWNADHNVTDVSWGVSRNISRVDSLFCEDYSAGWVGSSVELAANRKLVLDVHAAYSDLADGTEEQLQKLVDLKAADVSRLIREAYDGSWVVSPLGESGYCFKFHALTLDSSQEYTYYECAFHRNAVFAGLGIRMPTSMADDEDAIAVARAFDRRIQAAIDSVSIEGE